MSVPASARPVLLPHQALIGLSLAAGVVTAWLCVHIFAVFWLRWTPAAIVFSPGLIALQCWLSVGLFIVAHDCMHGSLMPGHPALNRAVGRFCLFLYAGFSYETVARSHFAHHRHPGTALDPDFSIEDPRHFWRWYAAFFRRYFGWQPAVTIAVVVFTDQVVLGASAVNLVLFWALPSLLSSVQLFYFGTYLPHRQEEQPFEDGHNARSSGFSTPLSLLTCYHFGHHHEHHATPQTPWWRLHRARIS